MERYWRCLVRIKLNLEGLPVPVRTWLREEKKKKGGSCPNSPGNRNSEQTNLTICLHFARVYQCMQIAWKMCFLWLYRLVSPMVSGTGWWGDRNCWWMGGERVCCSGCSCPTVSETCMYWDRRDALLCHNHMTSALSLPASAGAAVWGAHKSLVTFCTPSSHTFPAFITVGLEMLEGLSQPKTFKISLWTRPKAGVSGFEPTDSVCFWKLPWLKVPAVDCSLLFKEVLAFVFKFTS